MNTLDIFCFTSVARTKSFSITARELLISQQAVSRHIKSMEDELGFPLFLRNYQNVHLTEAGELMLRYFLERDRLINSFRKTLSDDSPACLHIGISQWLGCTDSFQAILDRFSKRHPEVRLYIHELTASETQDLLLRDRLDLLLTTRYSASFLPIDWQMHPLSEEPVFLLGSSRRKYESDRLSVYPFFSSFGGEADADSARSQFRALCAEQGFCPEHVDILPDMGSVCISVLLNKGLAPSLRHSSLSANPDYTLLPTARTVTAVLCMPFQPGDPNLRELVRIAGESEASS